jgi:hypothetical protein
MVGSRQVTIEFLGNSNDLRGAVDSAERSTRGLSNTMRRVGRAAALGFAAAAVVVGKGLYEAAQAAVEDEASQKKLANTLKNATGATDDQIASVEDWINSTSLASGVADDELRPALSALAVATGDVGKAQDLTSLAMDVAAGKGKSLQSVADALAKAQNGNIGALGRLGIATKDAQGHTKTFAEIQDELAAKFKGASATAADTMQGKMARLQVAFHETMEAIGYKLLPILADLADWFLKKGLPAIQEFGGWIKEHLFPIFSDIVDVVGNVFSSSGGGAGGKIATDLGKIRDVVMAVVGVITDLWAKFGGDILTYVKSAFDNLMQIIGGALDVILGVIKVFTSLFKGDWQGVWDGIKLILSGALDIVLGLVKQALNSLRLAWALSWEAIKALASSVWDGIKSLVGKGVDALVGLLKSLPGRAKDALSDLAGKLRDVFDSAMSAGLEKVKNIGGDIVGWIKGIPSKIGQLAGDFKQVGKDLITAFINGLSNAAGFVSDIAGNIWSALKGMLNSAIDHINRALEFSVNTHVPGVGTISINPPDIPHMAKGGVVRRPTLALIGEDGPEAVVPLGAKNAPRGGLSVGGPATTVQVIVQTLDPRTAGKAVLDALRQVERQTGRPLLVSGA